MSFLFASFSKDLARWRQDPAAFLIWLAIPLLIGGLMTTITGGGSGGPSGTLLISDEDDSLLSGFIAGVFAQDQLGELLTVQTVTITEGTELIEAGDASGFLIIPEGFQDAFLNDVPITLTLKTNPSQTILPGIIEDVTEIILNLGFYVQAMFGEELKEITNSDSATTPDEVFVADIAVRIQQKISSLDSVLFPLALELDIVEPPPAEPQVDLGLLFLPGVAMMAVLFSSQGLASDFWKEREKGTLRRLVSTPGLQRQFVVGKALAASAVISTIAGITLFLGFLWHGISWFKFPSSMLWLSIAAVGLFAWFAALQMLFPSQKAASLITLIVLFPLMMMGGSFFPFEALPDWLADIGRLSPNGFVVDRLTSELVSVGNWTYDAKSWAILVAMAATGLAICSWRLQSGFAKR